MKKPKFSAGLWFAAGPVDRFAPSGYKAPTSVKQQIQIAGKVRGLEGIECHQIDFRHISVREYLKLCEDNGLVTTNVNTNVWTDPKFHYGAFTHTDRKVRREAIDEGKKAVDVARKVGSPGIGLWLGSDGHDYPFQTDYLTHWNLLVEAIDEVTRYAQPDIKAGLEYKLREPRNRMTIGDVGKALAICLELGHENLGVAVDFGHALMAREFPGESCAILARHKKLFNVHFNDALRDWDDDMIAGTVHVWETMEFMYWAKQTYDGWFGIDMFPYREDSRKACELAVQNLKYIWDLASEIPVEKMRRAQHTMDPTVSHPIVQKVLFGK